MARKTICLRVDAETQLLGAKTAVTTGLAQIIPYCIQKSRLDIAIITIGNTDLGNILLVYLTLTTDI